MAVKKVDMATKSDRIYEYLRNAIVTGELLPREKLNITALAYQFEVSEIPVREALKRLQEHRLVKIVPYTGYFVQEFTMDELSDLWAIRFSLESLAVEQIIQRFDGTFPPEITELMDQMDECVRKGDGALFAELNKKFHLRFYRLCRNERLVELISNIWEEAERAQKVFRIRRTRITDSMQEHRMFLEAVADRDLERALSILKLHRSTNLQILKTLQGENNKLETSIGGSADETAMVRQRD